MNGIIKEKVEGLIKEGINIEIDKSGANLSSFKSGGTIHLVVYPKSNAELITTVEMLSNEKYHLIGAGTNTLIDDNGLDIVICTKKIKGFSFEDNLLTVNAGETLSELSYRTAKMGLSGLEFASGIPGSIGGAIAMNAGAFGGRIGDCVQSVTVYRNGQMLELSREKLTMTYRHCSLDGGIVLSCTLKLTHADSDECLSRIERFSRLRISTQPRQPSLGSVFQKVDGISAGVYIDRAGLKGYRLGGAEISSMHANFIVNIAKASSSDYLQLMQTASERVLDKFGIILKPEIKYIKDR